MKIVCACLVFLMAAGFTTNAQIKIGLPLGLADSSAVLDLSNAGGSFNKGFLLPQVNLSSSIVWGLLGTIVTDGMVVYNKATAGSGNTAVLPGLYFWAGGKWTTLSQTTATTATFPYCNSAAFYPAVSSGILYNNTAYAATYSLGYTAGSGLGYGSISQTISGLTLTRVAGSYAAGGGNVVYNLSGTYTGTSNSTVSFTIIECGSTAVYGVGIVIDNIRNALSTSLAVYDAAPAGSWVNVTGSEYSYAQSVVASTSIIGTPDIDLNKATANLSANSYNTNGNMALPPNNYLFGFSVMPQATGTTGNSWTIGASTANLSSNYNNFPAGVLFPTVNAVLGTRVNFLFKKQTTIIGSTNYLAFASSNGQAFVNGNATNTTLGVYYSNLTGTIPNQSAPAFTQYQSTTMAPGFQFLATPTRQW